MGPEKHDITLTYGRNNEHGWQRLYVSETQSKRDMKGKKTKAKVAKSFHVDPSLPMKVVLSLFKPQREGTLEIELTHTQKCQN